MRCTILFCFVLDISIVSWTYITVLTLIIQFQLFESITIVSTCQKEEEEVWDYSSHSIFEIFIEID
jgi:hypothetical protein